MTVSLLVGAIRTLVPDTQSPGRILAVLNERMIGRSQGGFTTCLALRVDPDGTLTIANAGHLAPYVQGKELETNPALASRTLRRLLRFKPNFNSAKTRD